MAAKINVEVKLASNEYDWGSPPATEVTVCWSASKIHETEAILDTNDALISSNRVHSFAINVSNDKAAVKTHSLNKDTDGYINTFILQGGHYYKIGKSNELVPVAVVQATTDKLSWTQSGSGATVSVKQFSENWVLVQAHGGNWGTRNSCKDLREGTEPVLKSNVKSIYDCVSADVKAFDYNHDAKTCLLFKSNTKFNPVITHTSGRGSRPATECYMLNSEYEKLKSLNNSSRPNSGGGRIPNFEIPNFDGTGGFGGFSGFNSWR